MRKRLITIERLEEIAIAAIAGGYGTMETSFDGTRLMRVCKLHIQKNCSQPYGFELFSSVSAWHGRKERPMTVIGAAPCRKCENCEKDRERFWKGRAMAEFQLSPRTWWATFTLTIDHHYELDNRADRRMHAAGVNFNSLSADERFRVRAEEFGLELTKYLKRLRAGDGWQIKAGHHIKPKCRYLLVAEAHDSAETSDELRGRPHFHMLLHEVVAGTLVLPYETELRWLKSRGKWQQGLFVRDEAFIRKNWQLGFSKIQLASDARTVFYLCKYITKSLAVRVRASKRYGEGAGGVLTKSLRRKMTL